MPDPTIGQPPTISIVVPAYNEAERIGPTLEAIHSHLGSRGEPFEIIVVDDGSTDATGEVVSRASESLGPDVHLLSRGENRGKGYSVREGMLAARGAFRLFADADNSTPIEELDRLLAKQASTGAGVVIASRAMRESHLEVRQPWAREMMGRAFNLVVRICGLSGFPDTQCGFKLFTAEAAEAVFPRLTVDRWGFDVETLWVARSLGYRVEQVPVRWLDSPRSRVTALGGAAAFLDILRVRWNSVRGVYRRGGR